MYSKEPFSQQNLPPIYRQQVHPYQEPLLIKIKRALAPLGFVILASLKFLPVLLKTGGTMILAIGAYAMLWGWWFALGFVILLFVHECGHLVAAKRIGLKVGAPVFIPFMGAIIALKEVPKNAWIEAQVGIGGPLLGTAGAVVCYFLYPITGNPIFAALAYFGFFLNLFNLIPLTPLDGGRVVAAISPWLWVGGLIFLGIWGFTHFNPIIFLIIIISIPQVMSLFREKSQDEVEYYQVAKSQRWLMSGVYIGLAVFLTWAMNVSHALLAPYQSR